MAYLLKTACYHQISYLLIFACCFGYCGSGFFGLVVSTIWTSLTYLIHIPELCVLFYS